MQQIRRVNVTNQVVEYLKENIESGNWSVGEKIPSEHQMTELLGVSRSSVRTAIQYMKTRFINLRTNIM